MIQLVACDIDGTLLREGQTEIAPEVFAQIRRLTEMGVIFCPASGRQLGSLQTLFAPVKEDLYILCENGAAIYDRGGKLLYSREIPRQTALALCRDILDTPGCEVLISCDNMSYLCPKEPGIVETMRNFDGNHTTIVDSPEQVPQPILKLAAYYKPGAEKIYPRFHERWGDRFSVAQSGKPWLDFTQTDKGEGLTKLCGILKLDPTNVMAFGDNYNDVPMLRVAGVPYLMEGAAEALKAEFSRHCADVAEVLAQL